MEEDTYFAYALDLKVLSTHFLKFQTFSANNISGKMF